MVWSGEAALLTGMLDSAPATTSDGVLGLGPGDMRLLSTSFTVSAVIKTT